MDWVWSEETVARALGLEPPVALPRFTFTSVQIDPDECCPGSLYVAVKWDLKGRLEEDAIRTAIRNGAVAVFSNLPRLTFRPSVPVIHAGPANAVLLAMAVYARAEYTGTVIAITGSVGKTTTKELTHHVLSASALASKSPGFRNGYGGLWQAMINRALGARFLVLEVATSNPGSMRRARHVRPAVGVVTNVGVSHLENYASRADLFREKLSLFDHLEGNRIGVVHRSVLDADEAGERLIPRKRLSRLLTVGLAAGNDVYPEDVSFDGVRTQGSVFVAGKRFRFTLPLPGRHFVENAMLALAVASALGLDIEKSVEALATAVPADRRFARYRVDLPGGPIELIDDCFNAAPASVAALLETLAERKAKRRVLVLGDMLALGSDTARYHAELAPLIERAEIGLLVTLGELASLANPGSVETVHFAEGGVAAAAVPDLIRPGDLAAVKASSGMRLVRVVDAIRALGVATPAGNWRVEDDAESAPLRAAI